MMSHWNEPISASKLDEIKSAATRDLTKQYKALERKDVMTIYEESILGAVWIELKRRFPKGAEAYLRARASDPLR